MSEPITWTNGRLRIGDLEPREDNPRQSTKKQVARIKQSVNDFGQVDILAVGPQNDKGKYPLYNGHQRYYAWLDEFGPDYMVDVRISNRPLETEEWQALTIMLHAGATGGWDWDKLPSIDTDILEGFGLLDADLLKGWQQDYFALGEMLAASETENKGKDTEPEMSRADELQQVWQVQVGDMFECGPHRIICGDCTDRAVVERVMGGEKADLVFTDPPYGVAIGDKNKFLNTFQPSGRCLENIAGDLMGKDELLDMLVKSFTLTREFMNDCCAIYVTAPQGGELGLMMMMMMMSGLPVRHVLNWVKNAPTFSMGRLDYEYQHEPILYTWKETHHHYGNGKFKTSVWEIDKPREAKEHPTMKPVELVENAVLNSSDAGQFVYDPFLGSGTTLIACHNLNRHCRGIELHPPYVAVCLDRFKRHTGIEPVRLAPTQP